MLYYSTNGLKNISFSQAVLEGLPKDNGLYMPYEFPKLPKSFIDNLPNMSFEQISQIVAEALLLSDIPQNILEQIVKKSINFPAPIINLHDNIFSLELFHGPTMAFKDFGARFMAQTMSYLIRNENKKLTIIVATSGDTGSAVANGFLGVEGIEVIILYPSGKVSPLQEAQLTTLGKNIKAVEVQGDFDACQKMAKLALNDEEIKNKCYLTSANSINIARLFPQMFYYFNAYAQAKKISDFEKIYICTPSGNFGNITAGLMSKKMGLPIDKFIAATNANDSVVRYLENGQYAPQKTIHTISSAMDVGAPSNFARIKDMYLDNPKKVKMDMEAFSYSDEEAKIIIKEIYLKYNYLLDPHGAVGYLGISNYMKNDKNCFKIFLETAHSGKFSEIIEEIIKEKINIPQRLKDTLEKEKEATLINNSYQELKEYIYYN